MFWELCVEKKFNPFNYDVLYKDEKEDRIQSMLLDFFDIYSATTLIYFDHKLADKISTLQCFYNYGVIFNKYKVLKLDKEYDNYVSTVVNDLKNFVEFISEQFDDLIDEFSYEKLNNILENYRQYVLAKKDKTYKCYIPQLENYGFEIFTKSSCYDPKVEEEFIQDVDYVPLTGSTFKERKFYGCPLDLNEYVEDGIADISSVAPTTFYKNLKYKVFGKPVEEIVTEKERLSISLYDILEK